MITKFTPFILLLSTFTSVSIGLINFDISPARAQSSDTQIDEQDSSPSISATEPSFSQKQSNQGIYSECQTFPYNLDPAHRPSSCLFHSDRDFFGFPYYRSVCSGGQCGQVYTDEHFRNHNRPNTHTPNNIRSNTSNRTHNSTRDANRNSPTQSHERVYFEGNQNSSTTRSSSQNISGQGHSGGGHNK